MNSTSKDPICGLADACRCRVEQWRDTADRTREGSERLDRAKVSQMTAIDDDRAVFTGELDHDMVESEMSATSFTVLDMLAS